MSEQDINATKNKKKLYKRWWFWVVIGLLFFTTVWVFSPSATNPKALNVNEGEQLSVAGIISGISNSALDGSGEITNYDCKLLSNIAIRNGGDFYNDDVCRAGTSGFIAKSTDSAQSKVITIYPRGSSNSIINCKEPTATFTFNPERTEIVSYSFEEEDCFQGVKLPISAVDVGTVQELSGYAERYQYKR